LTFSLITDVSEKTVTETHPPGDLLFPDLEGVGVCHSFPP
jgi:hypothetical protein